MNKFTQKNIGVIDCDFGNIASLINAIKYLGYNYKILKKPIDLNDISHLILPGVGSFNNSAKKLRNSGWSDYIKDFVKTKNFFLGICLGMQLMYEKSYEDGLETGLGFFEGTCEKFAANLDISLPHVGFNLVEHNSTKIWNNVPNHSPFYFVHSYRIKYPNKQNSFAKTFYGEYFVSAVENKNIFGFQFHPEKSQKPGLQLLKNFAELN